MSKLTTLTNEHDRITTVHGCGNWQIMRLVILNEPSFSKIRIICQSLRGCGRRRNWLIVRSDSLQACTCG